MRFTRILLQASQKKTTGIVGYPVHPDPRPHLISVYNKTLTALKEKIPPYAIYRQSTEAITNHRLSVVSQNTNVETIEEILDAGHIEEVIGVAEDELKLVDKMAEWKVWEPLHEKPLEGQWEYFKKAPEQE
ncbi:hypothetical protein BB559_006946 [Furculomyces boomerangus]|uniref:NADH dehydrogenase [ubiquinone] 1 alpha subcomplex subunit 5 n=2 Tax=Harpellales TaxID=61421 RepID=A0A2T9XZS3_9FUNG|nr:hypothetical protein BB559_006946 [Furculomyces boomerangus]PWA01277.1 hypothetical protein BB558_002641 [Smittium angustum]